MKRDNTIPYEPVGRLIEKAGAQRVAQHAKVALTDYLTEYALELGALAVKYAEHAGRKTVTDADITLARKNI